MDQDSSIERGNIFPTEKDYLLGIKGPLILGLKCNTIALFFYYNAFIKCCRSVKKIADDLDISPETVRKHRKILIDLGYIKYSYGSNVSETEVIHEAIDKKIKEYEISKKKFFKI